VCCLGLFDLVLVFPLSLSCIIQFSGVFLGLPSCDHEILPELCKFGYSPRLGPFAWPLDQYVLLDRMYQKGEVVLEVLIVVSESSSLVHLNDVLFLPSLSLSISSLNSSSIIALASPPVFQVIQFQSGEGLVTVKVVEEIVVIIAR